MNRLAIRTGKRDPFTPWHIPRSILRGFIDFEAYASAASVTDLISGAAFTAAGSVALGTGANGRQCALFDGVDDTFASSGIPTGWPTGAVAGWIFVICNQSVAALSANVSVVGYGSTGSSARRSLEIIPSLRIRYSIGDGSAAVFATDATTSFVGRHIVIGNADGANGWVEIDGIRTAASAAVIPATGTTRARIGANTATTAAAFLTGDISAIIVGAGSIDAYRTKLYDWVARTGR